MGGFADCMNQEAESQGVVLDLAEDGNLVFLSLLSEFFFLEVLPIADNGPCGRVKCVFGRFTGLVE